MRLAVTIAQKKDGDWDTLATPEVCVSDQVRAFKKLKLAKGDGQYKQAFVLTSSGTVKRAKFPQALTDAEKKAIAKETAKKVAEQKKAEADLVKRRADRLKAAGKTPPEKEKK